MYQSAFLAATRHFEHDIGASLAAQPVADNHHFVHLLWQQYHGRHITHLVVELLDETGHNCPVVFLCRPVQQEVLAPDKAPGTNKKDLHASVRVLTREGNHIVIGHTRAHDLLFLDNVLDGAKLVTDGNRLFKVKRLSRCLHLALQIGHHRLSMSGQEVT